MPRIRSLILVVLLLAPVAVAEAQKKPARPPAGSGPYGLVPTVSITAKPNPIVIGNATTISGSLRTNTANVRISLQARRYSPRGTFATIATTTTDRRGDYRFAPKPRFNTTYRVLAATQPAVRSSEPLVRVRMRVGVRTNRGTVRAGSFVRFTGRVFSRHNGRRAYIQRRSPTGRWVTVARPTLRTYDATSSRYSRRVRVRRTGVYRVKVLGHADHATGFSRLVGVTAV
jgi:hypothetical protein